MSLPKIDEVITLDESELEDEILNVKTELFKLRFRRATKQSFKSHQIKHSKHRLAQLLMVKKSENQRVVIEKEFKKISKEGR